MVFISFGWETILETQKAFPGNHCYWLTSTSIGLKTKLEELAEARLAGVNMRFSAIDKHAVEAAREKNLEILAWTVDDPVEARRLISLGVTKITTNRSAWLKQEVEK
jgi:glycerophosphoryl diester phosphodiesterase